MNDKVATVFREFILGNPLNFSYSDSFIGNFNQQLVTSIRFDILVVCVFILCFFCLVGTFITMISLSSLFRSCTFAVVIVYCFFCLQKCYQAESNLSTKKEENKSFKLTKHDLLNVNIHKLGSFLNINRKYDKENTSSNNLQTSKKNSKEKTSLGIVEDRKSAYLSKIKKQMTKKNKAEEDYKVFTDKIEEQQKEIKKSFSELKTAYYEFSKKGKKLNNELLAIDISVDLYDYEFKKFEDEIDKLYNLEEYKNDNGKSDVKTKKLLKTHQNRDVNDAKCNRTGIDKETDVESKNNTENNTNSCDNIGYSSNEDSDVTSKSDSDSDIVEPNRTKKIENATIEKNETQKCVVKHKKPMFKFLDLYNKLYLPDILDGFSTFSLSKNIKTDEKQKNTDQSMQDVQKYIANLKTTYFFETFIVFITLMLLTFGFLGLYVFFRVVLVLFLVSNVVFSLFVMIEAQILCKKCVLNESIQCNNKTKTNFDDFTAEIMMNLSIKNRGDNAIQLIVDEYDALNKDFVKKQKELETYLLNKYDIKIQKSIELLKILHKKLMFIESDFDSLMAKKVQKDAFYEDVKNIMDQTYKIEKITSKDDVKLAIDLLQRFTELAWFTGTESQEFEKNASSFIAENRKNDKKDSAKKCRQAVEKTCKIANDFDILYFTMLFFGSVLLVVVSL